MKYEEIKDRFPKTRPELPEEYKKIWNEHYLDSREGRTKATKASSVMERWLHRRVARTANASKTTLEIGAGTLNQLAFEKVGIYDVIEPQKMLYENSKYKKYVRNFYEDITCVRDNYKYDRIISVATFEHICNLPDVVSICARLLENDGVLGISIPNEGGWLWHFAYTNTTGKEFHKRYGLDYEKWMRYEHVNTADEIEAVLRFFFSDVRVKYCGVGKVFSFYRYYECRKPKADLS